VFKSYSVDLEADLNRTRLFIQGFLEGLGDTSKFHEFIDCAVKQKEINHMIDDFIILFNDFSIRKFNEIIYQLPAVIRSMFSLYDTC